MLIQRDLFTSGHEAYHTFRIPSIQQRRQAAYWLFAKVGDAVKEIAAI